MAAARLPVGRVSITARLLARACLLAGLALVSGPAQASDQFNVRMSLQGVDVPFDDDNRIQRGALLRLEVRIDNVRNDFRVGSVGFDFNLPDVLAVADNPGRQSNCGGELTTVAGSDQVLLQDVTLDVRDSCRVSWLVRAVSTGSFTVRVTVFSDQPGLTSVGISNLEVIPSGLINFSKTFSPETIGPDDVTRVTYTIDNRSSSTPPAIGFFGFLDRFTDGLVLADPPNVTNTCRNPSFPREYRIRRDFVNARFGEFRAGQNFCTISLDVRALRSGTFRDPPGDFTTQLNPNVATSNAGTVLMVLPREAPVFGKAFSPSTIAAGDPSRLTFRIDNASNGIDVGELAFADDFPDGLVVADPPNADTDCGGGTVSAPAGGRGMSFREGTVGARAHCTVSVDVQGQEQGDLENVSGALTSALPAAAPGAAATLTVRQPSLRISTSFEPAIIFPNGVSRLTYEIREVGRRTTSSGYDLSNLFLSGMQLAPDPDLQLCPMSSPTSNVVPGTGEFLLQGTLPADTAVCRISVNVTVPDVGTYTNTTTLDPELIGVTTTAVSVLTVAPVLPPGFSQAFSPTTINPSEITRLTYTIDNSINSGAEVGSLAFTDASSPGLGLSHVLNLENTCGGQTFVQRLQQDQFQVTFAEGTIAAGDTCTISFDVFGARAGTWETQSSELTSELPFPTAGAEATLTVNEVPLLFSMAFVPQAIDPGGTSTLTYTLENVTLAQARSISWSHALPRRLLVADPPNVETTCPDGTLTTGVDSLGRDLISYSGSLLDGNATCTATVDVTASRREEHLLSRDEHLVEDVTSSLGTSTFPLPAGVLVANIPKAETKGYRARPRAWPHHCCGSCGNVAGQCPKPYRSGS